ncbi:hypothetical protein Ahy_A04g018113 [Arachis hypogaea]|uniref:Aminotransferase-like plant mobile domain-containing protein n=1 Tax=Arachis hypogaea TaxID=3818 RepID=A0A445DCV8_ARAHY|nr:hypothetical protein Ahy_A04g018113 [Arachis hypogaea]
MTTMKEKAHYNMPNKDNRTVYRKMSQEKKDIVEEMGFGSLRQKYFLGNFDKECAGYECRRGGEPKKFKRTFVVFVQKCFLLPTTVSVASPIHKPLIFHVDNIREWDWAKHVLNFLMKGVENKREEKKQYVDCCIFVLMLIYFHETKFSRLFAPDAPPAPRVAHWTREMIIERISSETTQPLVTPLALSLPSSVQEELMKDDFIYVPPQEEIQQISNNDCPQEAEKQGVTVSLTSSVIEDLLKDDYVYEVSNEDPAKEQEQQAQESPVQQESEQEAPVNVCPPEPNKQGVRGSITSSVIKEFFKDANVYQVSDEEQS